LAGLAFDVGQFLGRRWAPSAARTTETA